MARLQVFKTIATLPATLEPDAIYYVRVGRGFDTYITNSLGVVVTYTPNIARIQKPLYTANFPDAAPLPNQTLKIDPTGDFQWWLAPIQDVYQQSTLANQSLRVWFGESTTANSAVVVYPTDDNTLNGNPLFSSIHHVKCDVSSGSSNLIDAIHCTTREITPDLKRITFNAMRGNIAMLAGTSVRPAPDNAPCRIVVIGMPV